MIRRSSFCPPQKLVYLQPQSHPRWGVIPCPIPSAFLVCGSTMVDTTASSKDHPSMNRPNNNDLGETTVAVSITSFPSVSPSDISSTQDNDNKTTTKTSRFLRLVPGRQAHQAIPTRGPLECRQEQRKKTNPNHCQTETYEFRLEDNHNHNDHHDEDDDQDMDPQYSKFQSRIQWRLPPQYHRKQNHQKEEEDDLRSNLASKTCTIAIPTISSHRRYSNHQYDSDRLVAWTCLLVSSIILATSNRYRLEHGT